MLLEFKIHDGRNSVEKNFMTTSSEVGAYETWTASSTEPFANKITFQHQKNTCLYCQSRRTLPQNKKCWQHTMHFLKSDMKKSKNKKCCSCTRTSDCVKMPDNSKSNVPRQQWWRRFERNEMLRLLVVGNQGEEYKLSLWPSHHTIGKDVSGHLVYMRTLDARTL